MEDSKRVEEEIMKVFDTPEMRKAQDEIFHNVFMWGQYAIHYPTLTVGATLEDVKYKLENGTGSAE